MEWQQQKQYWDKVAYEKEFRTPLQIDLLQRYLRPDAAILDYGCGYGRILSELYAAGYRHLAGVDISRLCWNGHEKSVRKLSFG